MFKKKKNYSAEPKDGVKFPTRYPMCEAAEPSVPTCVGGHILILIGA